jgi:hypothetical protein
MPKTNADQTRLLIEALLACPTLQTREGRDDVIAQLPAEIRNGIPRRDNLRADVIKLLEHCQNYTGGLQSLLDALDFYEGSSNPFMAVRKLCGPFLTGLPANHHPSSQDSRESRSINTGGGAYIQGDVNIQGGDFVGRDKYVNGKS